jgi:acetyl esterase/lipase
MGWTVGNVEYLIAAVAPATAAVVDATYALSLVVGRVEDYGIDTNRIVVNGESKSTVGHLVLAGVVIFESSGFTCRYEGGGFRGIDTAAP